MPPENPTNPIEVGSQLLIDEIPANGGHVFFGSGMLSDVSFLKVSDAATGPIPTFDTVVHASGNVDFPPGQPFLMPAGVIVEVKEIIEA